MTERIHSETTAEGAFHEESGRPRLAELEERVRELETALRAADGKLQIALEMGKLSAWERDLETGKITGSPTFMATLGLPPGTELSFEELQRIFHPDDAERIRQAVAYAERTNTQIAIEHRIIKANGQIARILVKARYIFENGKAVRLVGIIQDVTERARIKEEIQHVQRRQEFLLKLNDQLRSLDDPSAIMEATAQSLGQFVHVDCAGYGEVDEDQEIILVEREWSKGVISNEGRAYRLRDFVPTRLAELKAGRPVFVEDIRIDPRANNPAVQAAYSTINARSALGIPLLKDQKLTALLYMHSAEPRAWSADDIALAEDVAERTWTAVERARAERKLRETDALFRLIAESVPALVWIVNPQLELLYTNERWVTYLGLQPDEALGHSWKRVIHPDDLARMYRELEPVIAEHTSYTTELRNRTYDGDYRWHLIRAAPIHSPTGEFKGWVGTSVDIHDLKMTEEALRASEEQLRIAFQAARMGDWSWDIAAHTLTLSERAAEIFGLPSGSISREEVEERIHPLDLLRVKEAKNAAVHNRTDFNVELRIRRRPDDALIWVAAQGKVRFGPDDTVTGMTGVVQDITDRKHAEERQHLLIRELHHRVKNTLATVQAIVGSTARTASSIDEFYQGFVGRIVSLARTHTMLTEDLWQKAALEDLVQIELGPYEDEARNRVIIEGPHVELPSEAAVPIGMAIHELTTNAAKHGALSAFGGQVEVRWNVETRDRPVLHFSWVEKGGPRVGSPARQGFGTRLLQRVLATQLQAEVSMEFPKEGLRFSMTMPIPGTPPAFQPDH